MALLSAWSRYSPTSEPGRLAPLPGPADDPVVPVTTQAGGELVRPHGRECRVARQCGGLLLPGGQAGQQRVAVVALSCVDNGVAAGEERVELADLADLALHEVVEGVGPHGHAAGEPQVLRVCPRRDHALAEGDGRQRQVLEPGQLLGGPALQVGEGGRAQQRDRHALAGRCERPVSHRCPAGSARRRRGRPHARPSAACRGPCRSTARRSRSRRRARAGRRAARR